MSCSFLDSCGCECNSHYPEFDQLISSETKLDVNLIEICHSNIGWFSDKTLSTHHLIQDYTTDKTFGIYFLWHKDAYCELHNLYHMKSLYVGKGYIYRRIIEHFNRKDFSEEMLVYFTYFKTNNRLSKYLEQLILDIYNIPHNKYENKGQEKLCMYFTQSEVD